MRIKEPFIELLAIKLYEHDTSGGNAVPVHARNECWAKLPEEDREGYRRMARGDDPLYGEE